MTRFPSFMRFLSIPLNAYAGFLYFKHSSVTMGRGLVLSSLTFYMTDFVVVYLLSHIWLFCKPMDCSLPGSSVYGPEYWSGLSFPNAGDLPDPEIEPAYPYWQADSLPLSHQGSPI